MTGHDCLIVWAPACLLWIIAAPIAGNLQPIRAANPRQRAQTSHLILTLIFILISILELTSSAGQPGSTSSAVTCRKQSSPAAFLHGRMFRLSGNSREGGRTQWKECVYEKRVWEGYR